MNDVQTLVAPRSRDRLYYGWVVLAVAALAMVGTLPGRTQGLGLVTEPLIRDLGLSRVTFAQINLVATLVGAVFCLGVGRLIDAVGSRLVLTATAIALGLTVLAMSQATGAVAMLAAVTLTRGLGQSALSVISLAMVGKWFRRRLTAAMAIYALVLSVGFMMAFPVVGALVQTWGWRLAWSVVGAALLVGLAPIAWWFDRSSPEAMGLMVDGDGGGEATAEIAQPESAHATVGEALRSPAFWVFALASSVYGLVASGIGLLNESILAERGFAPDVYYTALAITAITGLAGNFAAGALAPRVSFRVILVAALAVLAAGLTGLAHVATEAQVMTQAVAMGVAGGFITVVFFSFWGRAYGRRHLGRIQGAAQAMTVIASAVGPLFLAQWVERTGSYSTAFYVLAAIVAALALATSIVTIPPGATNARRAEGTDVPALTLLQQIDAGSAPTIIDVRSRPEFMRGHVPGAMHLPFETLHQHVDEIPGSRHDPVVVYCGHGPRARLAGAVLRRRGFAHVKYLSGHFSKWAANRLPQQTD